MKAWLPEGMGGEWRLLFRASREGFAASVFHSKCDNKGTTVTIVKMGVRIFGGFTEEPSQINQVYSSFDFIYLVPITSRFCSERIPDIIIHWPKTCGFKKSSNTVWPVVRKSPYDNSMYYKLRKKVGICREKKAKS